MKTINEWESHNKDRTQWRKGVVYENDGEYSIKLYENGALVKALTMSIHNKAEFYANEEAENWCLNK